MNQKLMAKEERLKRYWQRVKQYRQNRVFQDNERKFYQQVGGNDTKTYQQPDARETEQFWSKIWQPREHNKKAEWKTLGHDGMHGFWFKKFTTIRDRLAHWSKKIPLKEPPQITTYPYHAYLRCGKYQRHK